MDDRTRQLMQRIDELEERLEGLERQRGILRIAGRWLESQRKTTRALLIAAVVVPVTAYAATISVPNTFVNGTPADADQVNANFSALVVESNAQDARIATLEASFVTGETLILQNQADIAANQASIATNSSSISTNTASTSTNSSGILVNTAVINTNAAGVAQNFSLIDDNQVAIGVLDSRFAGVTRSGDELTFSGMNLKIVSGSGSTFGAVNGLGNLIVGYNENSVSATRSGSHNLVVGDDHEFTSFGGLVAGWQNTISGARATVAGGWDNQATGSYAAVSGGEHNVSSGTASVVSGGTTNTASGARGTVAGGFNNTTAHPHSVVLGGNGQSSTTIWEVLAASITITDSLTIVGP